MTQATTATQSTDVRRDPGSRSSEIEGFVDSFDGRRVVGWAHDRAAPGRRLRIEVVVGDVVVAVVADEERRDVAGTGRNDGFCGFSAVPHLDVIAGDLIHVREASTGTELSGSPIDPARASNVPARTPHGIEGFIDFVDGNRIVGWIHDRAMPGRRLQVAITTGGTTVTTVADRFRQDVASSGLNDGRCGFEFDFDLREAGRRPVHVREVSTALELNGSPFRPDLVNRVAGQGGGGALDLLRAEAERAIERGRGLPPSVPGYGAETGDATPTRGSRLEHLLGTAFADRDPENLISRYAAFEVARSEKHRDLVPDGDLIERMRVLRWYLTECNIYHRLPVPLSPRQIAFLNAPMPLLASRDEISVAAHAFITGEFDPAIDLADPTALRKATFWWCVERSPQLAPGGELITPAQVRLLAALDPGTAAREFPLTHFLRAYQAADASLSGLNLQTDAARATLVAILLLRSLDRPHLARLMPGSLVSALIHSADPDRAPLLRDLLAVALGVIGAPDYPRAEALTAEITAQYAVRAPCALTAARRAVPISGAGLPFLRDPRIADRPEDGVAVIGPTRATSGLGQAMRLSLDILERAGRSPAQLDFFPGNPAPVGFAARAATAPSLTRPRRINLMHLNAEVVPHAFALLDRRITENSYNIGYFFWELDTVPECHRLALDLLDEIWVSSEYNRETYARGTQTPVHNVGMAVEELPDGPPLPRAALGVADDAFVFLATFDSFSFVERKNPLGLLTAFQAAFPPSADEAVALVLKTQNRSRIVSADQLRVWTRIEEIAARDPRISIVDRTLSYDALMGLKRSCDAYVSLHRSEGWGFGLLEAMQLGLPVIATGYSGNMDFCSPATAFLVDHTLVPVHPTDYVYVARESRWAEPSIASAAAAMRTVFAAPAERQSRAAAALRRVREAFSVAAIAARYGARLDAIEAAMVHLTFPPT